ncbi:MAG TPA: hypothetical protein VGE74_15345 [Gemmata sp.]
MYTDTTRSTPGHQNPSGNPEPREGVLARVQAVAHEFAARVRRALGHNDDSQPPGFNGAMLVA